MKVHFVFSTHGRALFLLLRKQILHRIVPLFIIGICVGHTETNAQCSESEIFQKYWQYKQTLERHFIVQDRNEEQGCINDGIGSFTSDTTKDNDLCTFDKAGYGLPATHLWLSPQGWGAPGHQLSIRFDTTKPLPILDRDCGGNISWGDAGPGDPNHRFNWLDYGSETLTQVGWYLTTLATEYELMKRSGQVEQQQKILEDIFLTLQAIRRLDMEAQCMVAQMYEKRAPNEDLVCEEPYVQVGIEDINPFNSQPCHRHFDTKVKEGCNFTPDLSGYSGFMLRSDARQGLDDLLNDDSDETWNVDGIGGAFGGLGHQDTACREVDPFCYMVFEQHFISHDQIINLMYGLAFLKKFIPENAQVTLCNGDTISVLNIAQNISQGIAMNVLSDPGSHIIVPGSDECCEKTAKLSECEGGWLFTTAYGVYKVNEMIQGTDSPNHKRTKRAMARAGHSPIGLQTKFEVGGANFASGRDFYLKQSLTFKEMSNVSNFNQGRIVDMADQANKEILLLGNDVLFPGGESMAEKIGGKEYFKSLLCSAPCTGPCKKGINYGEGWNAGARWPEGFECSNTPGWKGNRWDNTGEDPDAPGQPAPGAPGRSNGLDYMALFNMYMLKYGTDDFYNPSAVEPNPKLTITNDSELTGPSVLCALGKGIYEIVAPQPSFNTEWESSSNIALSNLSFKSAVGGFTTVEPGSKGSISASYTRTTVRDQYYNGVTGVATYNEIGQVIDYVDHGVFSEKCYNTQVKEVSQEKVDYDFILTVDPCSWIFMGEVIHDNNPAVNEELSYTWTVHNGQTQESFNGAFLDFYSFVYLNRVSGYYTINLNINGKCGVYNTQKTIYIEVCGDGGIIQKFVRVSPNPSNGVINVDLMHANGQTFSMAPAGYPARIRHVNGGPDLLNTRIYNNGQSVNVSQLSNGYYNFVVDLDGQTPISTTFVINK